MSNHSMVQFSWTRICARKLQFSTCFKNWRTNARNTIENLEVLRRGLYFLKASPCSEEVEDCTGRIPENAMQWIWKMPDITVNEGMHDFHYSKYCFVGIFLQKLRDKTAIWSLCFTDRLLCLLGISQRIVERWVNILSLGGTHSGLIKFPAIPKQQQVLEKRFSSMSQTASSLPWK